MQISLVVLAGAALNIQKEEIEALPEIGGLKRRPPDDRAVRMLNGPGRVNLWPTPAGMASQSKLRGSGR